MVKIFIDPGHGGSDPGATANGLLEKDICLEIGRLMEGILYESYEGYRLKLSRTTDKTLSLRERTDMANRWGADYLVSIHVNAGGGTGFESYIYNGTYANKRKTSRLRNFVHDEVVKSTGFRNRGKKEANFHMLRESRMPAILTENGFIDNARDANRLKSQTFLEGIARAHVRGIAKAFGLRKNSAGKRTSQGSSGSANDHELEQVVNNHAKNQYYHTIQPGDTLWSLAQQYDTTVEKLRTWNPSVVPERLQIGEKLVVGKSKGTSIHHFIEKGDTLWRLAIKYNTTVTRLLGLNEGIDPKRLQIGQRVRVR